MPARHRTNPIAPEADRRLSRFWVPRNGAVAHLRAALSNDLVLLRGPAGTGKTALLRQFAASLGTDPTVSVQLIDGASDETALDVDALDSASSRHVLLIDDHHDDGPGMDSEAVLRLLRTHESLHVVVATRRRTRLESPLIALEWDAHVVPRSMMLMTRDEVASVLSLNGVPHTEEAAEQLHDLTRGWPALVQLAATHLRLEGQRLRTQGEVSAIAHFASTAFVSDMERRLGRPTADIRMLSIPPYITPDLAAALGTPHDPAQLATLMDDMLRAGFVWPSPTRLTLAEPLRDRWLRDLVAERPEEVETARNVLLTHLVDSGEPLLAARLSADARNWSALACILAAAGPQIWAQDATEFGELVRALQAQGGTDPRTIEVLLTLCPETSESPDSPSLAVAALSKLPAAKHAATVDIPALASRIHLLRAAGRFTLADESARLLIDALRRAPDTGSRILAEAWYQVAMTHLAMGRIRDAAVSMSVSERSGTPPQRVRARGTLAVLSLIEGDVVEAQRSLAAVEGELWEASPWGEPLRFARAWFALEKGAPQEARKALERMPATHTARELWTFVASAHVLALLNEGNAFDGLGALRSWTQRSASLPASHFQMTQLLIARAKVMIALRQAKKAIALFDGPFGPSPVTAPTIALALLYAGHPHDAYVMSAKWELRAGTTPRAALENVVVNLIADVRLKGPAPRPATSRRAETLSTRHALWTPWGVVEPEDRGTVLSMLSTTAQHELARRPSVFESSVSAPRLSRRELVVLNLLARNSRVSDIAKTLVVSPNTVKSQLRSIYRKLEVSDRSSAIRVAHAWGLVDGEAAD